MTKISLQEYLNRKEMEWVGDDDDGAGGRC